MVGAPRKKMVGRYEVGWTIGHGSFAEVKFAVDLDTGVPVAMKVLDNATILNHRMLQQSSTSDCPLERLDELNLRAKNTVAFGESATVRVLHFTK
ncbi:hypothetical protein ZWY2020_042915 [Hordeum vulgare]|nr:hypothetical protein ZWY2020_042915 [Hordeum vulgare]